MTAQKATAPGKEPGPLGRAKGNAHEGRTETRSHHSTSEAIAPLAATKHAALLIAGGFRVVPTNGKVATEEAYGFRKDCPTFSLAAEFFGNPGTVPGILCGPTADPTCDWWIVCLDHDGDFNDPAVRSFIDPLPETLTSHEGRHLFFAVPPCPERDQLKQWPHIIDGLSGAHLDIKWCGGYACERGDWSETPSLDAIAELPIEALRELIRLGPKSEQNRIAVRAQHVAEESPVLLEDACAWLKSDTAPIAKQGKKGHNTLLVIAGGLLVGFGLNEESALELMLDHYNERCEPPWDDHEAEVQFQHKINEIEAKGSEVWQPGELAALYRALRHGLPGDDEPANDTKTAVTAPAPQPPRPGFFHTQGWGEIMAPLGDVPWLCRDLDLVRGRPTVLVGKAGQGKTWTAQAIALAVATGLPVFGRFPVRQGPVLHLDLDQGAFLTKQRYQQLARGAGVVGDVPLTFASTFHKLDEQAARAALLEQCAGKALCVVDCLRNASSEDENSSAFAQPLNMLQQVSEQTGCTFIVLHHSGKGEGTEDVDVLRGTSAIAGAAGAVLRVTRTEGEPARVGFLRGAGYRDRPQPFALEMAYQGLLDDPATGVRLAWRDLSGEKQNTVSKEDFSIRQTVLHSLQREPGQSLKGLALACGKKQSRVANVVEAMQGDAAAPGERVYCYSAGRGGRRDGYFLEPSETAVLHVLSAGGAHTDVALEDATGLHKGAVADALKLLRSRGQVLPITSGEVEAWMLAPGATDGE